MFFFFYFAGACSTRDQVSTAVSPFVQSHARTPFGSSADAQRSETQDTIAPGTHKFGENEDVSYIYI